MADTADTHLTQEEENVLLQQSDSDSEYEDAPETVSPDTDKNLSRDFSETLKVSECDTRPNDEESEMQTSSENKEDNVHRTDNTVGGQSLGEESPPRHSSIGEPDKEASVDSSGDKIPLSGDRLGESGDPSAGTDADPVAAAENDSGDSDGERDEDKVTIDEEAIKAKEAAMTEEEREGKKAEAQELKAKGNELFRDQQYEAAIESYTDALMCCPMCYAKERSIMYSNRAACKYKLEKYESSIEDSTKAVELNPNYMKALLRRAELYEKTEKLDEALADYQKVLEMDPGLHQARAACMRLPDQIKERNEKMKDEMLGKLKDLGNMILRPFGMSTDNFQMQQNPDTGSYSMNFVQNPGNNNS